MAAIVLGIAALGVWARPHGTAEPVHVSDAAAVEQLAGTDVKRVTLSAEAASRVDIQVTPVLAGASAGQTTIPYAAVFYDLQGATWAYTSTEPLSYVRQPVEVRTVKGDQALLSKGPAVGTPVVTVGAPELYGVELGVGTDE
jgi:hypothetical protein